jgi:hypothetical protein
MTSLRAWALDTAERAVFTFLEAFLGLLVVSASDAIGGLSISTIEAALVSGVISALAVVKGAIASYREGMSPASLVRSSEP